jgi:hypothetical protein
LSGAREADEHKRREGHSIFVNEKAGAVRRKIHITTPEARILLRMADLSWVAVKSQVTRLFFPDGWANAALIQWVYFTDPREKL